MTAIYDHLIAVLLAGAVMLILIGVGRGMTRSSVEAVQTRADAVSMADLDAMLEADLANLGADVPADQPVVLTNAWTGTSRRFEFQAASGGGLVTVRYALDASTDPGCPPSGACFAFRRLVDSGAGFVEAGGTTSLLRDMTLTLVSPSGVPDEARLAEVSLTLVPRFAAGAAGETVRERVWERRIPLLNLRFRQSV